MVARYRSNLPGRRPPCAFRICPMSCWNVTTWRCFRSVRYAMSRCRGVRLVSSRMPSFFCFWEPAMRWDLSIKASLVRLPGLSRIPPTSVSRTSCPDRGWAWSRSRNYIHRSLVSPYFSCSWLNLCIYANEKNWKFCLNINDFDNAWTALETW